MNRATPASSADPDTKQSKKEELDALLRPIPGFDTPGRPTGTCQAFKDMASKYRQTKDKDLRKKMRDHFDTCNICKKALEI